MGMTSTRVLLDLLGYDAASELPPARLCIEADHFLQDLFKPVSEVVYIPAQIVAAHIDRSED